MNTEVHNPIQTLSRMISSCADKEREIIICDDGSGAEYQTALRNLCRNQRDTEIFSPLKRNRLRCIFMDRNRGQQIATIAGMSVARGSWIITMDDDGEHPPECIEELIARGEEGNDLVYAAVKQPEKRKTTCMRRTGSALNQFLFTRFLGLPKEVRVSSFRAIRATWFRQTFENLENPFPYLSAMLLREGPRVSSIRYSGKAASASRYSIASLALIWWKLFRFWGPLRFIPSERPHLTADDIRSMYREK
ncbi:MAG: glycosyltransferase [Spirochaetales bacterium]|nr:glycosyltransferase [Spirochaetales bacterium]